MKRRAITYFTIAFAFILIAACEYLPGRYTPIKEIIAAPTKFEGKEVRLHGAAKNVTKIPFIDLKLYTLQDGTGEIPVVTQGDVPAEGEKLTVKGVVESAAIVNGESVGLRVKENERN